MVQCDFNPVCERDIDILIAEAFATDSDFLPYYLEKSRLLDGQNKLISLPTDYTVSKVELWSKDANGESDITVIISDGITNIGLLIEDKIKAPAQKNQSAGYTERGERQLDISFASFYTFIICPEKYFETNTEAKKYQYYVSYEDIRDYYVDKTDPVSLFRYNQIMQAIQRAKRSSETEINEIVHAFYEKYYDYVKGHERYHELDIRTSRTSNGYWPQFATLFGKAYIQHKINFAQVDLTFPKAKDCTLDAVHICNWMKQHGTVGIHAFATKDSVIISTTVPKIDYSIAFEDQIPAINDGLDAVQMFTDLANLLYCGQRLIGRK